MSLPKVGSELAKTSHWGKMKLRCTESVKRKLQVVQGRKLIGQNREPLQLLVEKVKFSEKSKKARARRNRRQPEK